MSIHADKENTLFDLPCVCLCEHVSDVDHTAMSVVQYLLGIVFFLYYTEPILDSLSPKSLDLQRKRIMYGKLLSVRTGLHNPVT